MEVSASPVLTLIMSRYVTNGSKGGNCMITRKPLLISQANLISGVWAGQLGDGVSYTIYWRRLTNSTNSGVARNKSF